MADDDVADRHTALSPRVDVEVAGVFWAIADALDAVAAQLAVIEERMGIAESADYQDAKRRVQSARAELFQWIDTNK